MESVTQFFNGIGDRLCHFLVDVFRGGMIFLFIAYMIAFAEELHRAHISTPIAWCGWVFEIMVAIALVAMAWPRKAERAAAEAAGSAPKYGSPWPFLALIAVPPLVCAAIANLFAYQFKTPLLESTQKLIGNIL